MNVVFIPLACKVKKQQAAAFKEYAAQRGKTSNTMLKEYVIDCISKDETMERDKERGEGNAQAKDLP